MLRFAAKTLVAALAAGSAFVGVVWADSAIGTGRWSASTGDMLNSLGVKIQARAANNAEMNGYKWGGRITRDGFATAGDGGQATYTHNATACAISGGDGGYQIPSGTGGCWLADIRSGASLALWGAKDDNSTNNQPVFAKAVAAMASVGGGRIRIPKGAACYRIASTVTLASDRVVLAAEPGACVDIAFASGPGILLGQLIGTGNDTKRVANGVDGLTFTHSVTRTSGADVQLYNSDQAFAYDVTCKVGNWQCIAIDNNATNTVIRNLQVREEGQIGIAFGCNTAGLAANVSVITGDFNFQHGAALEFCNASGVVMSHFNTDFNYRNLWAHPGTGQVVSSLRATSVFFDYSTADNVVFDASGGGKVSENVFEPSTWIVTAGQSIPSTFLPGLVAPYAVNATATGLLLQGNGSDPSTFTNNSFKAMVFNAGGNGVVLNGGRYNQLGGISAQNGQNCSSGTCHNVAIGSGTSNWSWDGTAGGTTGLGGTIKTGYGVFVNAGASDYYTVRGDLSGNVTGGLRDLGTGLRKSFEGMVPAQTNTAYTPTVTTNSGTLSAYTATGQWIQHGSTITFATSVAITNNGTGALTVNIGLPLTPSSAVPLNFFGREAQSGKPVVGIVSGSTMTVVLSNENSYPGGNGTRIDITGSFPIAQ